MRGAKGLTAMPIGSEGANTVATIAFVVASITDTVLLWVLATKTRVPPRLTATPVGPKPTGTVATTVFVKLSMTETLPLPELAT